MGLISSRGEDLTVYRHSAGLIITLSSDLIDGNTLSMVVNGEDVSVPFAVDHDSSMQALCVAVESVDGVDACEWNEELPRQVTIQLPGEVSVENAIISGGASQSTVSLSGCYVNGTFVESAASSLTVRAMVQPLSGRELLLLSEGERTKETVKLYSPVELMTSNRAGMTKADELVRPNGRRYRVISCEPWQVPGLGSSHYKVTATAFAGEG